MDYKCEKRKNVNEWRVEMAAIRWVVTSSKKNLIITMPFFSRIQMSSFVFGAITSIKEWSLPKFYHFLKFPPSMEKKKTDVPWGEQEMHWKMPRSRHGVKLSSSQPGCRVATLHSFGKHVHRIEFKLFEEVLSWTYFPSINSVFTAWERIMVS